MPMISLQVSNSLMDELDEIQKKLGFTSRSEALRVSINNFIRENQKQITSEKHRIASITVHHEIRDDILDKFSILIQDYQRLIKSINQYNLKNVIIKSIIVAGSGIEINDFYQSLSSNRLFKVTITYIIISKDEEKDKI